MSLAILAVFLLVPFVATADEMECSYMMVAPSAISLGPGASDEVYVTILDTEKRPIAGHLVTALSDNPELLLIQPTEALTDDTGKALFNLTGLAGLDWCPIKVSFVCEDREALIHID